jgi:hypothetical protein
VVEHSAHNRRVIGSIPIGPNMKINNLYKFFDYFGLVVFLFLMIDSLMYIKVGMVDWRIILRLIIGIGGIVIGGIVIDGYLVFIYKEKE